MTDIHTHILPGIDDGARDAAESIALLRMEREQGVTTVVLTPHFYRDRENPKSFLRRREKAALELSRALLELPEEERETLPRLVIGAEVAFAPNLADWEELPQLCIGETQNLLLELPFTPWNSRMIDEIYDLISRTGITPVIAHLERYLSIQKGELIGEVLALGVPVQVTGDVLTGWRTRRTALRLLEGRGDRLIASDCHRTDTRPPVMKAALDVAKKKLGEPRTAALLRCADELASV